MLKTIDSEGVIYYDRVLINNIYGQGFHFTNDLMPLYHMLSYLKKYANLSKEAKQRLKWMDYHRQCGNASKTCRYFGISRQCFYEWYRRYDPNNLYTLENKSTTPIRKRQREITPEQEMRVVQLRKKYICYSKIKLAKIYLREYDELISSWKIQKVIEKYKLYPNPRKTARITHKRLNAIKKKRITLLKKKPKNGFLVCLDAIEIRWNNFKRYIFTGIDSYSKVAFARMYKNANSYNASDFLNRLMYLTDGQIENIQTDNGSEFEKYFRQSCDKLNLKRYYSRPRTPKDNPVNERFNRTVEDEFINLGNFTTDVVSFNHNLTEWLIEYNFKRPHQTLNYETPINFNNSIKVSPMYPSSTPSCLAVKSLDEFTLHHWDYAGRKKENPWLFPKKTHPLCKLKCHDRVHQIASMLVFHLEILGKTDKEGLVRRVARILNVDKKDVRFVLMKELKRAKVIKEEKGRCELMMLGDRRVTNIKMYAEIKHPELIRKIDELKRLLHNPD